MKRVILTFEEDGTVRVEAEGFAGKVCEVATRPYEDDFGGVTKRTPKAEAARSAQRAQDRSRLR